MSSGVRPTRSSAMLVILNLSRGLLSLTSMQLPFFSGIGAFANFFLLEVSCLQVRASHYLGVLSPSFIFTLTAITNNAFEICTNASYCWPRNYETWRHYSWIMRGSHLSYNMSIILKLKGHMKGRLISKISNFWENLSSGLKIIC